MRLSIPALALITTSTALFNACSPAATSTHSPAPRTPAVATADTQPAKATEPTASDESGQTAASETPSTPASESDGIRKASRPPHDLITAPGVLFVFNFAESEVGASAKERCQQSAEEDAAALRACLTAARAKVPVESVQFTKDKAGNWWWVTYNNYKGNLLKWNKVQFALGEQTSDEITLKLSGKDKGIAPMPRVPKTLSINLPNDYSIVVRHPDFGGMTFDAKIGILAPDSES